jgi:hypothetical protein
MNAVARLWAAGLKVTANGDALVVAPRWALTEELRELIKRNKQELLRELGEIEERRVRLQDLAQELRERPSDRCAFEVTESDPIAVSLAIRTITGIVVGELAIERHRWDRALFLRTLEETSRRPQ